jgi:cyclic pyranopterin phosphate synthase
VPSPTLESAVYSFEGLLPELESPPIAARRALDHAGARLSVEGWRSLPAEDRERLTLAGVADRVDADLVTSLLRRAVPPPQKVAPAADPDPTTPPEALARALEPQRSIEPKRWARLRGVDRYALAHTYRRAVARSAFSLLGEALDAVLLAGSVTMGDPQRVPQTPPPAPAYQPAGYYSSAEEAAPAQPRVATTTPRGRPVEAVPPAVAMPPQKRPTMPRQAVQAAQGGALSNHLNEAGEVHMVDVARKPTTERRAVARGAVRMRAETIARLAQRDTPKGEVLATARLAGIMAAKRTHEIIPLCHAIALTHLEVILDVDEAAATVHVTAIADAFDRTGCEMEALVAVSTACLTVYDMLKGIDREMVISDVMLVEKSGGRSGHFRRTGDEP